MLSFILYTIFMCFVSYFIPGPILKPIMIVVLLVICWNFAKLISVRNLSGGIYYKVIMLVFAVGTLFMVAKGFVIDRDHLITYFFFPYSLLSYLLPVVLLLPLTTPVFIRAVIFYSNKLGIVFLILFPILMVTGYSGANGGFEMCVWLFTSGCGFILLTAYFQKRGDIVRSVIVLVIGLLLVTILARRNIMITCIGYMAASFSIYVVYNKNLTLLQRAISIVMILGVIGVVGYSFSTGSGGIFANIAQRATENTREEAFAWYIMDMDENPNNWIYGKGFNGTFYSPGVEYDIEFEDSIEEGGRDRDYRSVVESGYLTLVLKGGIIYLILYLLVLIPAVIKGFFFSNNIFVKGCAALIVLWLIDMAPFGLPIFMLRYFLVWFCVAICYSKQIRLMNNDKFRMYLGAEEEQGSEEGIDNVQNGKRRRTFRLN